MSAADLFDISGMTRETEPKSFWAKVGEVGMFGLGLVIVAGEGVVKLGEVVIDAVTPVVEEYGPAVVDFAKQNPGLIVDMAGMAVGVPIFPMGMLADQVIQHKRNTDAAAEEAD